MHKVKGWHSRGYLPHLDSDSRTQFVTIRLHDSLPDDVLFRMKDELRLKNAHGIDDLELQRRIDKFLDSGYGECWLRRPEIAQIVEDSLMAADHEFCDLRAWVVMPNHAHMLLRPNENVSLTSIMQRIKGSSAFAANRVLGRSGSFWMRDYFDRYIRDPEHYWKSIRYIEMNPVKAGLCLDPADWRFGSAWWKAREDANQSSR